MTVREAAKLLRVSTSTILTWLRTGELAASDIRPTPGVGRPRWHITDDAVRDFLISRQPIPVTEQRRRTGKRSVREWVK